MYPAKFDYYRAGSVDEALQLLGQHPEAKILAGGHSLLPVMKQRLSQPSALVDIGHVDELHGLVAADGVLRIGALTTHAEIAASEAVRTHCSVLAQAAARIGDPAVRNKGTLGGNIAHADPASDLPGALVAAGATIMAVSARGARSFPAADFFVGLLESQLTDDEILTGVEIPSLEGSGHCYLKVEHPASGYAVCGAAAVVTADGGSIGSCSLAFNGVTATPLRAGSVADSLAGQGADGIVSAVDRHLTVHEPLSDPYASGEYRVALAREYGKRALSAAAERAGL